MSEQKEVMGTITMPMSQAATLSYYVVLALVQAQNQFEKAIPEQRDFYEGELRKAEAMHALMDKWTWK